MSIGEWLSFVLVMLLALYGCAHLIRRVSLRLARCPRSVRFYRIALPPAGAVEPLVRCLQTQAAWDENREQTLVLLPEDSAGMAVARLLAEENPHVMPLTVADLFALLTEEMKRSR